MCALKNDIEQSKQQLSALNSFIEHKQQAVTTLMNLQMVGFSEKDIMELTGLVNKRSGIVSLGLSQGNGNNGSSSTNWKLDDRLIGH